MDVIDWLLEGDPALRWLRVLDWWDHGAREAT
jgi:hypothetical protein